MQNAECKQLRADLCEKSKLYEVWDNETNEMHKRYKSVIQWKKRAHKQSVVNEITNSHNTEHMWKLLKSLSPKYSEQIPIENEDFCIVCQNNKIKYNMEYFDDAFEKEIMNLINHFIPILKKTQPQTFITKY